MQTSKTSVFIFIVYTPQREWWDFVLQQLQLVALPEQCGALPTKIFYFCKVKVHSNICMSHDKILEMSLSPCHIFGCVQIQGPCPSKDLVNVGRILCQQGTKMGRKCLYFGLYRFQLYAPFFGVSCNLTTMTALNRNNDH